MAERKTTVTANGGLGVEDYLDGATLRRRYSIDPTNMVEVEDLEDDEHVIVATADGVRSITKEDLMANVGLPYMLSRTVYFGGTIGEDVDDDANLQKFIPGVAGKTCRLVSAMVVGCEGNYGASGNTVISVSALPYDDEETDPSTVTLAYNASTTAPQVLNIPLTDTPLQGYCWISTAGEHAGLQIVFDIEVLA